MNQFEIIYGFVILKITQLGLAGQHLYKVHFPNEVPDITIESITAHGENYWDTVPGGNRELGTSIGKLVADHLHIEQK